jgi:hypothetical protein
MISDDHDYIGIGPCFKFFTFSPVLHEDSNGENSQENIIAYDRDGSIYRRHRPDVEEIRAVLDVRSYYYFLHCTKASACTEFDQSKNSLEIAEGRLHKNISTAI